MSGPPNRHFLILNYLRFFPSVMTRLQRVSLALIAMAFFASQWAVAAPQLISHIKDKANRPSTILDVHETCELYLSVDAVSDNGGTLSYQWKRGTTTLTAANTMHNGMSRGAVNGAVLNLVPSLLSDAGDYTCIITDSNGGSITVGVSGATPYKVAAVDIRPGGVLAAGGQGKATLKVLAAASSGLQYRWYRRTNASGAVIDLKLTSTMPKFSGTNTHTLSINNVTPAEVGQYFCRVFFSGYSMDGGYQHFAVVPAPASRSFGIGETASMEVVPEGVSGFDSLSYQWKRGTVMLPGPEGTANPLLVNNVQLTDAGAYTCIVGGVFRGANVPATTTSAGQLFVVNNTAAQVLGVAGKSVVLSFSPAGSSPSHTYQWYKKVGLTETPLADGAKYTGATTAALTILNAGEADAIDYFCRVTAYGDTDDAGLRSVIVIPAPASTTVAAGETAELTVLPAGASPATIGNMEFQWKKGATALAGQTNQTLSIPNATAADAGDYSCVVTLTGAGSVTSPVGKIAVVDSADARVLAVEAGSADLSVTASTDLSQTYQWFRVGVGGPDVQINNSAKYAGATTKKLTVKLLTAADAADYYCRVTSYGIPANSGLRRLVVVPKPASRTVLSGQPLMLAVNPVGAPLGDFSFQWKKGATTISGATSNEYLIPSAVLGDAGSYTCVVTLTNVKTLNSAAAAVVVVDSTPFTRLSVTGKDATLEVAVKGLGSTYQWFRVVDGFPDVPLADNLDYAGCLSRKLTVKAATVERAGAYRCRVTTFGESVTTSIATLVLLPPPDSKLAEIGSTVELDLLPAGATPGMLGNMSFQWKKTQNISNATTSTLTIPNVQLPDNGTYSCIVTLPGALPATLTSPGAKVNVVNTAATTRMVLQGASPAFEVPVGGLGQTYQWYKQVDMNPPVPVTESAVFVGTTTKKLTVKGATLPDAGTYFCRVSAFGIDVDSDLHRLVVISPPASVLMDRGDDLTLEVMSAGQHMALTYQWYKGTAILSGQTSATFEIPTIQTSHAGDYSCVVTLAGVGSVKTPAAKVSVVDHTQANILVIKGKDAKLPVSTGGSGYVFKWYRADNPSLFLTDGVEYGGTKTNTLTVKLTDNADAGEYVCEVTAHGRLVAIGQRNLEVITSPTSTLVAVGSELELEVTTTNTLAGLTYQWKKGTSAISGANSAVFNVPSAVLNDAADYSCVVGLTGSASVTTAAAKVAVAEVAPKTVQVKQGATATLTAVTKGLGITYAWYRSGSGTPLSGAKYSGVLTNSLKISNCQHDDDAGDYVCKITANGVELTTGAVTLQVLRAPVLGAVSLPLGIVGRSYSYQIPVDADPLRQPNKYNATPLPAGLTINTNTGLISGKPTTAVTNFNVTVSATNDIGTDSAVFQVTINALPTYLAGSYAGPVPRHALNGDLGGALQMEVASTGVATGKLFFGSASHAFTGSLELSSTDSNTATATATINVSRGTSLSALTMTFNIGDDSLLTGGVLTDGTSNISFHGWRNAFSGGAGTGYEGLHNFAFGLPELDPSVGQASVPQGVGFGSFTLSNAGVVTFGGTSTLMADGASLGTYSTIIGPSGQFVIFKPLYTTTQKGSILAELDLDDKGNANSDDNTLSGTGTWSRPADPSSTQRTYKAGFGPVNLTFEGGRYVAPSLVLGVTAGNNNAKLEFEQGGLPARLDPNVSVSIQAGNVVTVNAPNPAGTKFASTSTAASMTSTGYFKGEFTLFDDDPTTAANNNNEVKRVVTFVGIIYPKGTGLTGAGYFLMPQLPSDGPPPTTSSNSPILSGGAFFEKN
jgi:hypothetical protein